MKISLKRIVFLKQREKVLLNELKQIKEEILFIESLKNDQLEVYEKIIVKHDSIGIEQKQLKISIRQELKKQGKNVDWLAKELGKSTGTVRNWFYANYYITEENIREIEAALKKGGQQ
ncbi:hypothetical protein [Akkermansia muciniphila]|uniref:hypothetical protein n=1 Tax=Akkermansia muciniphila TaxID=239935 RepID=UPI000C9B8267|nr:hypothetical protein [Akkermansia muciniphila]PNC05624.1 hypothetical protein CXU21_00820 [Akkermansia muciniphila]